MCRSGVGSTVAGGLARAALALLAGCSAIGPGTAVDDSALSAGRALRDADLPAPLTKDEIRGTHALSAERFEAKWQASLADDAQKFMRAYPAAFHLDLKQVPRSRIPGGEGICVGDAHPDNFGFLQVAEAHGRTTIYGFNDLDDSGRCPVAIDALRYYVIFRLRFGDGAKLDQSLDHYLGEAFGDEARTPVEAAWHDVKDDAPDWSDVRHDVLHDYVEDDAFRDDLSADDLLPVDGATRSSVTAVLTHASSAPGVRVLDVGERPRTDGGSGGLTRYWAYVAMRDGARTILELKEEAQPGVDFGYADQPLSASERLPVLKSALWNVTGADDDFEVTIGPKKLLVRDRARKASVDPKGDERDAQAKYLGALHHDAWSGVRKSDARAWLEGSSKLVAKRWKKVFERERDAAR